MILSYIDFNANGIVAEFDVDAIDAISSLILLFE